jgi:hypothetical protein
VFDLVLLLGVDTEQALSFFSMRVPMTFGPITTFYLSQSLTQIFVLTSAPNTNLVQFLASPKSCLLGVTDVFRCALWCYKQVQRGTCLFDWLIVFAVVLEL